MEFRPCIDIHNGQVKQIVGGSLTDTGNKVLENFVSTKDGTYYGNLYKEMGLTGGHVILLNPVGSEYYQATKEQAIKALTAFPGGLQVGGGITDENAAEFMKAGASHVIVTSYVFKDGVIWYEHLEKLKAAVGKEHIVLDVSCRKKNDAYYVVTDRWQKFTKEEVNHKLLDTLSSYCDEFLIHAADVEGKSAGIEEPLVRLLGEWGKIPVTYAGGVGSYEDITKIKELGKGKLNVTIGSALDIFGGSLSLQSILTLLH